MPAAYTTVSSLRGSKVATWVFVIWLIHLYSDTLTFRTWSLFRKAFPKDIDRHSTFRVLDRESENLLPSVIDRLVKLDLGMLTFLCIQTFNLTIDQLIAFAKINTLAVLALEVGRDSLAFWNGTMSIQTIRNWGRSVGESGAFKELRVLVVDGCNSLPRRSVLKSISSFPSLNLAGIFGSDDPPKAEDCWEDWHLRFSPKWVTHNEMLARFTNKVIPALVTKHYSIACGELLIPREHSTCDVCMISPWRYPKTFLLATGHTSRCPCNILSIIRQGWLESPHGSSGS